MESKAEEIRMILQEKVQISELTAIAKGNYSQVVAQLYECWRANQLTVTRWKHGEAGTQEESVLYSNSAFFLQEDCVQLKSAINNADIKIATWNVNSIRARLPLLLSWLQEQQPDIVCLQETKVEDHQFPEWELKTAGYSAVFSGQKSYNGVAILSKAPIDAVKYGFSSQYDSSEKRLISASILGIQVINVYIPQGQTFDSPKFAYKQEFLRNLVDELRQNYSPEDPIVLAGDYNIAPDERDVFSVELMRGKVSFLPVEHGYLASLRQWGLADLFRKFNEGGQKYTWWDFRTRGFEKNEGLRIDHLWGTSAAYERCKSVEIDTDNRSQSKPSDHAPFLCSLAPTVS